MLDFKLSKERLSSSVLVLSDRHVSEIAKDMIENGNQKESFYIFDIDVAYEHVRNIKEKMPRVQIFYAMKANDYSMMVKLAIALGLGFDCASPGEINTLREHNVLPTSIIYAAPMKMPEQMKFARDSGVRHTTFDSTCELNRLSQYWPDARLLIRLKLESNSAYNLGDKFGCEFDEALNLLDEAAQLNMTVIGVAFHVGSGCFSKQSYTTGLKLSRALFDHEAKKGRKMTLLDIGGGFFADDTELFNQVADLINTGIEKWFPDQNIQIIAEPGRYLCEKAFTLYSSIRNTRIINNGDKTIQMVYLNNGIYGSLRAIEKWHVMDKLQRTKDNRKTKVDLQETLIWGPTPDNKDFLEETKLAPCVSQDWIVFHQQGAYCRTFSSTFCVMEDTLSVISEKLWIMLKNKPVFTGIFLMDSTMPVCLPSTLPPILPDTGKYVHSISSTIIE